MTARMPRWDGRCELTFTDADGTVLFKEPTTAARCGLKARKYEPLPGGGSRTTVTFDADPHEHLYGMGEYQQPRHGPQGHDPGTGAPQLAGVGAVRRLLEGLRLPLAQPGGRPRHLRQNRTQWQAAACDQIDYWVNRRDSPRRSSGSTPTPPATRPSCRSGAWASGSASCATGTRSSCLRPPARFKRRNIPIDLIVIDFFHWPLMGDFRFDAEFLARPEGHGRRTA